MEQLSRCSSVRAGDAAAGAYCWTAGPSAVSQSMRYELARLDFLQKQSLLVCLTARELGVQFGLVCVIAAVQGRTGGQVPPGTRSLYNKTNASRRDPFPTSASRCSTH